MSIDGLFFLSVKTVLASWWTVSTVIRKSEDEVAQPCLNLERPHDEALATIESAAVRYRIALGPIAGRNTLRLHIPGATAISVQAATPPTATRDGFSLNASVACQDEERNKKRRLAI